LNPVCGWILPAPAVPWISGHIKMPMGNDDYAARLRALLGGPKGAPPLPFARRLGFGESQHI
jgi:hypothetical protein